MTLGFAATALLSAQASQALPFSDDFTGGPAPQWGNEAGNWFESGGVYQAQNPDNFPVTYSSLPDDLSDLVFSTDINGVSDGGVWLHSTYTGTGSIGAEGVLLVTLGNQLYWHVVAGGSYGSSLNPVNAGSYTNLKVEVSGDTYSAFVDGSATAATTLTNSTYTSGRVAVYSNSAQSFDNVNLVPEPASLALIACGACALVRRRR